MGNFCHEKLSSGKIFIGESDAFLKKIVTFRKFS